MSRQVNKDKLSIMPWINTEYSYKLAKRMEQFRSNPVLGYRPAGSAAEFATGEMLFQEMERIGLKDVHKDAIRVDSWEFHKAELVWNTEDGSEGLRAVLGGYQTNFQTGGPREFGLVYVGKGTAEDYDGKDVKGKLVLADINQREEWWINFPVYQAYVRGAAAFIAVQEGGFAEIHDEALNAQDIAGPAEAAAFSMSRADAAVLKRALEGKEEIRVWFDADTCVKEKQTSYNIIGTIPGEDQEQMILLSAHYDSYFSGFQDDNAAVALMFGIAKALIDSGYKPKKTLVFAALAAEEWGIVNSKYDWSTGAYQQVFHVRPEWQGKVVADLNFELPAHAHDTKDAVRTVYEYVTFLTKAIEGIPVDQEAYPDGLEIHAPIQTMSDDFSMAISGIPSMVNEFADGSFMETHYHSQFDNEDYYHEPVYRFHHLLYGTLVKEFDKIVLPPFDFSVLFEAMNKSLDMRYSGIIGDLGEKLNQVTIEAASLGKEVYQWIEKVNESGAALKNAEEYRKILMNAFRKAQDSFVRLDWQDTVLFPQQAVRQNLTHVKDAISRLEQGNAIGALDAIYEIDNNCYAFQFDEEVFNYFTDYVFCQPKERLQWGAGRIVHHENLFQLVQKLKKKSVPGEADFDEELRILNRVRKNQEECYKSDLEYMIRETENIINSLKKIQQMAGKE